MRKFLFLSILLLVWGTIVGGQTREADISDTSLFEPISTPNNVPLCRLNSVAKCGRDFLTAKNLLGLGGEDNFKTQEEVFNFKNGTKGYLFSILGTKPSFNVETRYRVDFEPVKNGFRFVGAGAQYRCLINNQRGSWQKTPCNFDDGRGAYLADGPTLIEDVVDGANFRTVPVTGVGVQKMSFPCTDSLAMCGRDMFNTLYKPAGFEEIPQGNIKVEEFNISDKEPEVGIYLVTLLNLQDDSVQGERYRIAFQKRGNSWVLESGAKQSLCARGDLAGKWTKETCE